jgi:hypothetical protein
VKLVELAHADHTVIDANVEPPVDETNARQQQIVLDGARNRVDREAVLGVRLQPEHDAHQEEWGRRRPRLRRA